MAKFTSTVALNIRWKDHWEFVGPAGTVFRIDDSLYDEFNAWATGLIPGLTWTVTDELAAAGTPSSTVVAETSFGISQAAGTTNSFSRGDHTHGSPTNPVTAHEAAADPHTAYQRESEKDAASGYVGLSAASHIVLGADVDLYRGAANVLNVDDEIAATRGAAANNALSAKVTGDTDPRLLINASGVINLGSGAAAPDVTLYRAAASALATDDALRVLGAELQIGSDVRLTRPAAKVLAIDGGASSVAALIRWGGTSFPASPASGDLAYRTDLGMLFFYDGTRWLSSQLFAAHSGAFAAGAVYAVSISATQTVATRWNFYGTDIGSDIYIEDVKCAVFVASGGSALSASHKWVGSILKVDTANATTSIATLTLDAGASNAWRLLSASIDALLGTSAVYPTGRIDWTRTGTPGDLNIGAPTILTYRIVAT